MTNEEASPEAPRMSPLERRSTAAERPMMSPPTRPAAGVKYSMMVIVVVVDGDLKTTREL